MVRFLDNDQAVKHQTTLLAQLVQSRGDALTLAWRRSKSGLEIDSRLRQVSGNCLRLSVPLSSTHQLLDNLLSETDRVVVADLGTGIIRVGFDADDEKVIDIARRLRAEAFSAGRFALRRARVGCRQTRGGCLGRNRADRRANEIDKGKVRSEISFESGAFCVGDLICNLNVDCNR